MFKKLNLLLVVVLLVTTTVLSSSVALADGGINVSLDSAGISWQAQGNNDGVHLLVNGPDGFHVDEVYGGSSGSFNATGGDGAYNYELTTIPHVDDNVRNAMNSVEQGDRAALEQQLRDAGKISDPVSVSGAFYMTGGAVSNYDGDEFDANEDQVILDDLIVDGSICAGFDCVNGESFGFDTIRLKENNLRIRAQDTSNSASFPTRDWQITFNDSSNGGANKFSIDDIDGGRTPFTIEAGAPSHSLYVDDGGKIGFGTSTPVVDLHVKSGNTPTLRLEQDGSSGFTPQTWDMAGNEANFFIRDATNGSTLPFRIFPGAPSDALNIEASTGDIGIGTTSPAHELEVEGNVGTGHVAARIKNTDLTGWSTMWIGNGNDGYSRGNSGSVWGDKLRIFTSTAVPIAFATTDTDRLYIEAGGNIGIGLDTGITHLLHVNGVARSTQAAWDTSSDRRAKTNIEPLTGNLEKIMGLNPVSYEYKESFKGDNEALEGVKIGFIAQEVAEVDPTMVSEVTETFGYNTIDDFKVLNTSNMVPMLVGAVQEQQLIIDDLQQQNADLEARLAALEALILDQ